MPRVRFLDGTRPRPGHGALPLALAVLSLAPTAAGARPRQDRALDVGPAPTIREDREQDENERAAVELGESIVTPTLSERSLLDTPCAAEVVSSRRIEERACRTTPQILSELPGVMVQETSTGHGSPYIRGFTSFRTLLLVDGIRLNNSVFREGPNQYWNTVDPLMIARLEVVKGPSSVLYGSDAVGGTVNAFTKGPSTSPADPFAGSLYYRASSAESSHVGRLESSARLDESTNLWLGLSTKQFGDLEAGRGTGVQPNTGYDDWSGDLKLEHMLGPNLRLDLAHQTSSQDGVPRTHKTVHAVPFEGTTVGSDLRHDFDQERRLTYVQLHAADLDGPVRSFDTSVSWHEQGEVRDRIKGSGSRDLQGFDVGTLGFFAHLRSSTAAGELTYGVEYYRDDVDSFTNKLADQTAADDIQGPVADDATYDLLGLFVQDEIEVSRRLDLVLGARFNYAAVDADSVRDPVTDARVSIRDDWNDLVGSARFLYELSEDGGGPNLFGGVSQGFRAPNLSDLTRFDSARSNEFEIPATDLEAERYLTFELGLKGGSERLSAQVAAFYTDVRDLIQRFPTGAVNADGEAEVTKDNVGDGYVQGIEVGAAWGFRSDWTLFGNATWIEGRVETFATSAPVLSEEYLDLLMPLTAQVGLRWDDPRGKLWAEGVVLAAADADRLSPRDVADTSRIPPGGTPGYEVLSLRGGYELSDAVSLHAALENVFDEDYRVHGSGQNRPGRNLVVGARWSF